LRFNIPLAIYFLCPLVYGGYMNNEAQNSEGMGIIHKAEANIDRADVISKSEFHKFAIDRRRGWC
jgi:hypothetical protein